MARTSNITFGQVAAIADAMKAAGTRPTARALRERIGSGSMGTIHNLLKQWSGKANENEDDSEAAELPSHIQSALMDFIGTEIATACEPINEELQAAKEAADDIAQDNERLNRAYDEQGKDLQHCQQERAAAMAQLNLTRDVLASHESEVFKLRAQVTELLRDLDRSQRQVEMFANYEPELRTAQQELNTLRAGYQDAEKRAAVFAAQLGAKNDAADQLSKQLEKAESRASSAEAEAKQNGKHYEACAARLEAAAREIETLRKPKPAAKVTAPKTTKKATVANT